MRNINITRADPAVAPILGITQTNTRTGRELRIKMCGTQGFEHEISVAVNWPTLSNDWVGGSMTLAEARAFFRAGLQLVEQEEKKQ